MRVSLISFLVVCLAAACSPVNVQTDVNSTANFSEMKTFDWLDTTASPGSNARVNNPELAALVRAATEKNLQKKGFVKDGNADFLVNWLGAVEDKVQKESIQHFYSSYGYGTLSAGIAEQDKETTTVRSYEEGIIVIDILDPQKHVILWTGTGTRRLTKGMSKAQVARYINLSVDEILKSFPPGSK
jgi:hypothetical protein